MGFFENETWIDISMWISYIMIFATVFIMIGFFVYHAILNPKGALQSLAAVAGLLVIYGITYLIADGNTFTNVNDEVLLEGSASRAVGAGIITAYIMIFAAVAGLIYSEVMSFVKR